MFKGVWPHLWWCRGRSSRPFPSRRRCAGWRPWPRTAVYWKAKQSRGVHSQTWEGARSGGRERFQPETKRSWVGLVPFIARLPVGYAQRRIHLHDSPLNYVCSNESLLWLRGRMSKHDGGWMQVALRPPALYDDVCGFDVSVQVCCCFVCRGCWCGVYLLMKAKCPASTERLPKSSAVGASLHFFTPLRLYVGISGRV